ncbi:uncharacterized protein AMSG_07609 [Thecamonas trahens ATCC 50062]|uniref:Uncharacterized protein n=1 Tax=Thecamonas trahens ATCC 50062 TaxID=461836 RepID=A0A0L0DGU4_THETB|nr:hypothetical protein AMSG_07609 [Thecamonas trahens ATCC 50062]KNC51420.1 hypothetical protein AMSG_07609 [Thecamonas trahens ATCC 50062]|eukprot:XP_013756086.1 hypothetical protein AMSG_07609 [Thecamonas trahens ATCC 50062]
MEIKQACGQWGVLAGAVAYLLPLGFSTAAYVVCCLCAVGTYLISLYNTVGLVQANKEWLARAMMDNNTHYVLYSVAAAVQPPALARVTPLVLFAAYQVANWMHSTGSAPAALAGPVAVFLTQQTTLFQIISQIEVMTVAMAVIFVPFGRSSLADAAILCNFIYLRYAVSPFTRASFATVATYTDPLLASPRTPGPIAWAYRKFKSLAPPIVPATA